MLQKENIMNIKSNDDLIIELMACFLLTFRKKFSLLLASFYLNTEVLFKMRSFHKARY